MKKQTPTTKGGVTKYKSKLATRALSLWFKYGKASKPPFCEVCEAANGAMLANAKGVLHPQYLNGHHVEEKMNYALRNDPMNHVLLCPTCHKWGVTSAHRAPAWFIEWMRQTRPEQLAYIQQNRLAKPSSRDETSVESLEAQVERLETLLRELNAKPKV
jgi:hypothetical protein